MTALLLAGSVSAQQPDGVKRRPRIEGSWWQVASNPDLGVLGSDQQEPVDFGIWQAAHGTWQLWSCIRKTGEPGKTRLFYGWEGPTLSSPDWRPLGIRMQGKPEVGETRGGLQAPHVTVVGDTYHMLYGDWQHICRATSRDGKLFQRELQGRGRVTGLFDESPHANTRDPMVIKIGDIYHCYYVVPETNVFRSRNPMDFGIESDEDTWVGSLPVAAPELIHHDGQWYIAALRPELDGIRIARLTWDAAE